MKDRPIRILFVAHSPHRGGAEYCLDTTLRYIDQRNFKPIVVFPFDGPMAEESRELEIETIITPMCHWLYVDKGLWYWKNLIGRSISNVKRLKSLIDHHDIDVVYTNTSAIFEPSLAARKAGVPHLWHIHEVLKPGNRMSQLLPITWMQRFIRNHADQIVFESKSALDTFQQTTPVPGAKIVYNSVRLPMEDRPTEEAIRQSRQRLGISPDRPMITFVGQFIDRKNPLLLIEAIAKIKKNVDVACLFAGEGPLESQMTDKITTCALQDQCKIIPFQDDIRDVMIAADVLALPSVQESFGLVLLEAAAYQKPVVACHSQGPSEIIVDGETGFLTPQGDAEQMAKALLQLITNKHLQTNFGDAAHTRVQRLYSPMANTQQISSIIASLTSEPIPLKNNADFE